MKTLSQWIDVLAKTYAQTRGMSEAQRGIYRLALSDIGQHDLEIGFQRVLNTWRFANLVPPPAFVRDCVAGAIEQENYLTHPRGEPATERLTVEQAWDDWISQKEALDALHKALGVVERHLSEQTPRESLQARRLRLKEQAQQIKEKYGRKTMGVRGTASPETNKGASGAERTSEKPTNRTPDGGGSGE